MFTEDDYRATLASMAQDEEESRIVDRRICVCGHPATAHTDYAKKDNLYHRDLRNSGMKACVVAKSECPCQMMIPVGTAQDARIFRYVSRGSGPLHALTRGVAKSWEKEKDFQWNDDLQCSFCSPGDGRAADGVHLTPVVLRNDGHESDRPTKFNAILCDDHRNDLIQKATRGEVHYE